MENLNTSYSHCGTTIRFMALLVRFALLIGFLQLVEQVLGDLWLISVDEMLYVIISMKKSLMILESTVLERKKILLYDLKMPYLKEKWKVRTYYHANSILTSLMHGLTYWFMLYVSVRITMQRVSCINATRKFGLNFDGIVLSRDWFHIRLHYWWISWPKSLDLHQVTYIMSNVDTGRVRILCERGSFVYVLRINFELIIWAIELIFTKLKDTLNST